jgi:uncharacterized protein
MIPQKNLSMISNATAIDGRRVPESVIERDYCIAWLLVGLSNSPLKKALAFKGGTALRRCHFLDYRFSEDLDFTLIAEVDLDSILSGFDDIFEWVRVQSGIEFKTARKEPDGQCSHTIYFSYEGPIPGRPREIKVDITFKEKIVTRVEEKSVIKTYDEYDDLPENATIIVYSLEEIVVEKIAALSDPARCEPRDLYDLFFLADHVELDFLGDRVKEKVQFKGDDLQNREGNLEKKGQRLSKQWNKRLSHQMTELPEFDEVFRLVRRIFRQANLF